MKTKFFNPENVKIIINECIGFESGISAKIAVKADVIDRETGLKVDEIKFSGVNALYWDMDGEYFNEFLINAMINEAEYVDIWDIFTEEQKEWIKENEYIDCYDDDLNMTKEQIKIYEDLTDQVWNDWHIEINNDLIAESDEDYLDITDMYFNDINCIYDEDDDFYLINNGELVDLDENIDEVFDMNTEETIMRIKFQGKYYYLNMFGDELVRDDKTAKKVTQRMIDNFYFPDNVKVGDTIYEYSEVA